MNPKPAWIAVIGPSPESQGGIARVLAQVAEIEMPVEGPRLVAVESFRGGGAAAKLRSWLFGWTRFALLCSLRRPALSYVHIGKGASTVRKASFVAVSRAARVPVLLHVHPARFFDQLTSRGIAGVLARRCLEASVAVIVLAEPFADEVHALDPDLVVHVVPNAPDVDERSPADPADGRIPGRILCVGSFVGDKGVDVLLEAIARIAPDFPTLRLVLAGTGPDEGELRALAAARGLAERIEFPGWLRGAALEAEYSRASLFVLPSRTEGFPLALLEAMWHGVPCVATAVGAVPEILADGAGAVVPSQDAQALAETLRSLLEDPARAAAFGAAAGERARARYAPSRQRKAIGRLLLRYAGAPPVIAPPTARAGRPDATTPRAVPR